MGRALATRVGWTVVLAAAMGVSTAGAQPHVGPVPDGMYEGWSAVTLAPYGPLTSPQADVHARWLDVQTRAGVTSIRFMPDNVVRWVVRHGPHGVVEKVATVDGELWARSIFTYTAAGHLATKVVTGPAVGGGPIAFHYRTDARGRILSREPVDRTRPRLVHRIAARSTTVDTIDLRGEVIRRDLFDRQGRLLSTDVGHPVGSATTASLVYRRDARGRLRSIGRQLGGLAPIQPARPALRDPNLTYVHLQALQDNVMEHHEVLLLLGRPVTYSETHRGTARRARDDYFDSCQLERVNGFDYDAAGLLKSGRVDCICGFCVAQSAAPHGVDVIGRDLHWTDGPWVLLDGVEVTSDHAVLTPAGPRPAGDLRVGDRVRDASGGTRTLSRVERLPDGERLGVNLRTRSGTFEAGGMIFVSEDGRCP